MQLLSGKLRAGGHEYAVANLNEVFRRTLALSGTLLDIISSTGRYDREKLPPLPASGGT